MSTCSAYKCNYKHVNENSGKTIHKFPFSRPDLLQKWIQNIGRKNWIPTKSSILCSDHFEKDCFNIRDKKICLKNGAVPTIFHSSLMQKSTVLYPLFALNSAKNRQVTYNPHIVKCTNLNSLGNTILNDAENNNCQNMSVDKSLLPDKIAKCSMNSQINTLSNITKDVNFEETSIDKSSLPVAIKCQQNSQNNTLLKLAANDILRKTPVLNMKYIESLKNGPNLWKESLTDSSEEEWDVSSESEKTKSSQLIYKLPPTLWNGKICNAKFLLSTTNISKDCWKNDFLISRKIVEKDYCKHLYHQKKLKSTQQIILRKNKKLTALKQKIEELKKKPDVITKHLKNIPDGVQLDFIKSLLNSKTKNVHFPESIKTLSATLYGISPRAYEYVRSQFQNALPRPTSAYSYQRKKILQHKAIAKPHFSVKAYIRSLRTELKNKSNTDSKNVCELPSLSSSISNNTAEGKSEVQFAVNNSNELQFNNSDLSTKTNEAANDLFSIAVKSIFHKS